MEKSTDNIPPGSTIVYYCYECPGIYTKDSSCPTCNTVNQSFGWVNNGGKSNEKMRKM